MGKARDAEVPCRFCGGKDGDGHLFWECTFPPGLQVRELPEFVPLVARDRSKWPRRLLWHGWLPGLSLAGERDPRAALLGVLVDRVLEQQLGAYPADDSGSGLLLNSRMLRIWPYTLENTPVFGLIPFGGFEVAGAGLCLAASEEGFSECHLRENSDPRLVPLCWLRALSRLFSVPNFGCNLGIAGHVGIDNLNDRHGTNFTLTLPHVASAV